MNEETKSKEFERILEKAKNDDRIIGLILTGGRGKGMFTENWLWTSHLETAFRSRKKLMKRDVLEREKTAIVL